MVSCESTAKVSARSPAFHTELRSADRMALRNLLAHHDNARIKKITYCVSHVFSRCHWFLCKYSLTFSHYSRDNLTLTLICIDIVLRTFDFIFHLSDESVGRSILVRRLLLHSLVGPPQIHASRSPESHDRNKLLWHSRGYLHSP